MLTYVIISLTGAFGRKQQTRERQLLKGFNIAPVEGVDISSLAAKIMATSLNVIAAFMRAKVSSLTDTVALIYGEAWTVF